MNIINKNNITIKDVYNFLNEVKDEFPIPLDNKTNLKETAYKLYEYGDIFCVTKNNAIYGLIAGYNNDLEKQEGYISVVVLKKELRGRGLAYNLVNEFLKSSKEKSMKMVWLYTHNTNRKAISMYENVGFNIASNKGDDLILEKIL